jgi:hypothetical protein
MQLNFEADQKQKELFEESKASNLRGQSQNEEFTKMSVSFEHLRGEYQVLKAERDKLMHENSRLTHSEATLNAKVKMQFKEIENLQVKDMRTKSAMKV